MCYYNNIWSIRTDPRSLEETAWIPLADELSSLEDSSFVQTEGQLEDLPVLCAQNDEGVYFESSCSNGWITGATCSQARAWLNPFGRAKTTVGDLPAGQVPFDEVCDISVGSNHVVLGRYDSKLWTFGGNEHGQRGFENPPAQNGEQPGTCNSKGLEGWKTLDAFPPRSKVVQILCGKWNTFFIIERPTFRSTTEEEMNDAVQPMY